MSNIFSRAFLATHHKKQAGMSLLQMLALIALLGVVLALGANYLLHYLPR